MPKIIVGVDASEHSKDAIALAKRFARPSGAELVLVCAYPYDDHPSRAVNSEYRRYLEDDAEATLARARAQAGDVAATTHAIAEVSPAKALQSLAEREHAAMIVLGSSRQSAIGRVLAGSTAERLLHGAPCPVAVAPKGSRASEGMFTTVAVGYDGFPEAHAALAAAVAIASATGARVRVIEALDANPIGMPAMMAGPGYVTHPHEHMVRVQDEVDKIVASLPPGIVASPLAVAGDPERVLAEQSESAELMVVGSRGYGPHTAVLVGSVSGRLVRAAACPVLVTPRGIEAPLEPLFAAAAAQAV